MTFPNNVSNQSVLYSSVERHAVYIKKCKALQNLYCSTEVVEE